MRTFPYMDGDELIELVDIRELEKVKAQLDDIRRRLGGHASSKLDGEYGLAAATMNGYDKMLCALEQIEDIYVDADDLYESWKAIGEIARSTLEGDTALPKTKTKPTSNP
jgi:hypothetical protein